MSVKKLGELPNSEWKFKRAKKLPCRHPEHNPPMCISLEPGVYEHTCPACGKKQIFTVPLITFTETI